MNKEVMAMLGMKPVKKLSGGAHARNNPDVTVTLPKSGGLYISFRKDLMEKFGLLMKVYPHKNRLYFDGANKETDETYVTTSTMGEKRARIKIATRSLIEAGLDDKKINSFIGIHDLNYSKELDLYYITAGENEEDR